MHAPLLWVDVETTGLNPHGDRLLEVALLLTDEHLRELAHIRVVIGWRGLDMAELDPFVVKMHETSGLWVEVERSNLCVRQAEDQLVEWIERHGATGLYMAGSGVHFDRRWLRAHMPRVVKRFHYRNFDLTTLRYFFGSEKTAPAHRALTDLEQNVEDLRALAAQARAAGLVAVPGSQLARAAS